MHIDETLRDVGPASIVAFLIIKEVFSFMKGRKRNGNGDTWLVEAITEIRATLKVQTDLLRDIAKKD